MWVRSPSFKLDHYIFTGKEVKVSDIYKKEGREESSAGAMAWDALRLVLFLYMILWPHSRHRIGSRDLISFFAPQSS